jgi:hypothetical protein
MAWRLLARAAKIRPGRLLELARHAFLRVPGMMSHEERMDLYRTARGELRGRGIAIEFGACLGASAAAIQAGLRASRYPAARTAELHVVDCFSTPRDSAFAASVRELASAGRVDGLLREADGRLDFHDAFRANLDGGDRALHVHRCLAADFQPQHRPVELVHLDLPKDWAQAAPIVSAVFPDLVDGARIVLQDFGYQWSAELIALTGHLVAMGQLKPYRFVQTSLSCVARGPLAAGAIAELGRRMEGADGVLAGIDLAREACRALGSTAQALTLSMARAQHLHACGRQDECYAVVESILLQLRGHPDAVSLARLAELFEARFVLPACRQGS